MRGRTLRVLGVTLIGAMMLAPQLLFATIEEQRARLPPPASCQDPSEGVWMARVWHVPGQEWYIYTLEIHRAVRGQPTLTGALHARFWDGTMQVFEPTPCTAGHEDRTVFMTGVGSDMNGVLSFGGTSWRMESVQCGSPVLSGRYNLDQFSGRVDTTLQEFQSVNNDGGEAVNEPTVFRRIRCFDPSDTPPPRPTVLIAPPYTPPQRTTMGCSRSPR